MSIGEEEAFGLDEVGGDSQETAPVSADQPIQNLKAEFARKQANTEAQLHETKTQLDSLMAQLNSQQPKANSKADKDLMFDDPTAYAQMIESRAVQKAQQAVSNQMQAQQAIQNTVQTIQAQYAEFNETGSEAASLALSKAAKLPSHVRNTPEGIEIAMMQAVRELGLTPVSKKSPSTANEDFPTGSAQTRKAPPVQSKIDGQQRAFAKLLGIDLTNKVAAAEFEKASKRKNWGDPA